MSDYATSQIMQALERMIIVATVTQRSDDKVKVKWLDGAESDWLRLAQLGSGEQKFWIPQGPGDQVVVLSPGGDTTKGVVYPGPFAGGVPAGNFEGTFTGTGDVVASGISLVDHVHGDVQPGAADTGQPK
ncbi:phage baseplate assembly protein V [Pukyongiella litopenaei]|nr:phage baseplate assembly protein V [Pukyongiella litopenaei]